MGVQIINPPDAKTSAYRDDDEEQSKGRWSGRETPFGKIDATDKHNFLSQLFTKVDEQLKFLQKWRGVYYDQMWQLCDKAYYGWKTAIDLPDAEKDYRSNIRIRYAYQQVESQVSKIIPSLTGFDPPVTVYPNEADSDIREMKAKAIQKQLRYYFFQKQNSTELMINWIRQGERLGLSPFKMFWEYKERDGKVVRRPILDEEGVLVGVQRMELDGKHIVCDNPSCVNVNTRKFWWNLDAVNRESLRYCFESYWKPLNYLKESPLYIKSQTKNLVPDAFMDDNEDTSRSDQSKVENTGEDMVQVFERWDENFLIAFTKDRIIRFRDNPFDDGIIPYYFYRATILDDQFPGMGTIEPMLDLEELANVIVNQRLDNVHRIINRMLLVSSASGFNKKRVKFRPMGIHTCMNPDKVKPFPIEDVTQSAYIEQNNAERKMDGVTGDPDFTRGEVPGKSSESASMTQLRAMGAAGRTNLKVLCAQFTMGTMFRDMYRLEKQFGDPRKWVRVMGDEGIDFNFSHRELFVDDYEFDFTLGGYMGNRAIDFQQWVQGLSIIKDIPGVVNQFDPEEIAKTFNNASNIRGGDRLLKKPGMMYPGYYRDPYDENRRMTLDNIDIQVMPGERHTKHIPIHLRALDVGFLTPDARDRLLRHYYMHVNLLFEDMRAQGSVGGQISQLQGFIGQLAGGDRGGNMPGGTVQEQAYNVAAGPVGITGGGANVR